MNRRVHAVTGLVVGAGGYYVCCRLLGVKPTWGGALVCGGAAAGMACLPDLWEPALTPFHRGFFHSVVLNGGVVVGIGWAWKNPRISVEAKIGVAALGLGYVSHSFLDSMTPMGIPFLRGQAPKMTYRARARRLKPWR